LAAAPAGREPLPASPASQHAGDLPGTGRLARCAPARGAGRVSPGSINVGPGSQASVAARVWSNRPARCNRC